MGRRAITGAARRRMCVEERRGGGVGGRLAGRRRAASARPMWLGTRARLHPAAETPHVSADVLPMLLVVVPFFFLIGLPATVTATTKFDNAVVGVPLVVCEKERIVVEVQTERPFDGRIFVKGDFANPRCVRTYVYGQQISDDEPTIPDNERSSSRLFAPAQVRGEDEEVGGDEEVLSAPRVVDDVRRGIGGFTKNGGRGAFGGSREEKQSQSGNDLRVFNKSPSSQPAKQAGGPTECPNVCEPCDCEASTRRRRQTNRIQLQVPLHSCNTKRDRILNPPSLVISFVAVVSFHDSFITKLDKAYHIQCAYTESDKLVSTELNVSMAPEVDISGAREPPTCDYVISDDNGAPVHNTLVGDLVRHRWDCRTGAAGFYRMLVHDCFVEDGSGQAFQVVDETGCTLDKHMLQTPAYDSEGLTAQVEAYTFKFPDKSNVDFRCTITFCSVKDEECSTFSPPQCDSDKTTSRRRRRSMQSMQSLSLHANGLTVLDVDVDRGHDVMLPQPFTLLPPTSSEPSFCLSVSGFGILVSASTFLSTLSATVVFAYIYIRYNDKLQS